MPDQGVDINLLSIKEMSPFYTECDSKLVCQMAFWIPSLLSITIWNLHIFGEVVKHFFQEGRVCLTYYLWGWDHFLLNPSM